MATRTILRKYPHAWIALCLLTAAAPRVYRNYLPPFASESRPACRIARDRCLAAGDCIKLAKLVPGCQRNVRVSVIALGECNAVELCLAFAIGESEVNQAFGEPWISAQVEP